MAATLTHGGDLTYLSFPIIKTEMTPDGDVYVYGKATDGSVDSDEQIVDTDWSSKAIGEWLATGANVRVQHNAQRDPAGVGVEVDTDADGTTWVKSLVVEPVAKTLVLKKALRAYSVGISRPKIVRDSVARGGRIVDGEIIEISLVDRPANKNCGIQLMKSDSDGNAEVIGKMFGDSDLITKAAGGTIIDLDIKGKVSPAFSPADLAKLLKHREIAEKRGQIETVIRADGSTLTVDKRLMDPNVGGGVDRDKIPAKDFVDPGRRRFPIVTPGDVSDAASSFGRATPKIPLEDFKDRLTAIADRKGPEFVQELPQNWRDEMAGATKAKKKPAFPGAAKPFGAKDDDEGDIGGDGGQVNADEPDDAGDSSDDTDTDTADKAAGKPRQCADCNTFNDADAKTCSSCGHTLGTPAHGHTASGAVKGAKDCPGCGATFHADSKLRKCDKCGKSLPKAKGSKKPEVEKKDKAMCKGCGANIDAMHKFCPECGAKAAKAVPIKKNHDFTCLGCGNDLDSGEKYCPECGKQNPGYEGANMKASKPTPASGAVGATSIEPIPAHREPDGAVVESFEHDAGLPTTPDSSKSVDPETAAATRLKSLGVPTGLGAVHDLTCPGFHPLEADAAHPNGALKSMDLTYWQDTALDMASNGSLEDAMKAAKMWQDAVTLKGTDASVLEDIREDQYKAFKDANVGPASFPKPTELHATQFRRPALTAGQANAGPGHQGPNTHSVPSGTISADQYMRGPLTAGQAADSPSNKSTATIAAPVPAGEASRVYYRNTQRDSARSAMRTMHDHIAQTFPDLCPMAGPGQGGNAPEGQRPVPVPQLAGKAAETAPVVEAEPVKKNKKSKVNKAVGMTADANPELLKMMSDLAAQVGTLTKANKKLQKTVDALADLPDPSTAPFKGLAHKSMSMAAPAAARTVADTAEQTRMMMLRELEMQFRSTPDPAEREAAWKALTKMRGL